MSGGLASRQVQRSFTSRGHKLWPSPSSLTRWEHLQSANVCHTRTLGFIVSRVIGKLSWWTSVSNLHVFQINIKCLFGSLSEKCLKDLEIFHAWTFFSPTLILCIYVSPREKKTSFLWCLSQLRRALFSVFVRFMRVPRWPSPPVSDRALSQ